MNRNRRSGGAFGKGRPERHYAEKKPSPYFSLNTLTGQTHNCNDREHAIAYSIATNKRAHTRDWVPCYQGPNGFIML